MQKDNARIGLIQLLMPRLHLPSDEYTMPVRCPKHRFRAASAGKLAIIVRIHGHRGIYDFLLRTMTN